MDSIGNTILQQQRALFADQAAQNFAISAQAQAEATVTNQQVTAMKTQSVKVAGAANMEQAALSANAALEGSSLKGLGETQGAYRS